MAEAVTPQTSQNERDQWRPKYNPWLIAIVVTMAAFMEVLDTTIVNVSLPHIAGALGVSYDDATWALTSYLVANGIVLTISGWMARFFGRKRYFLICIVMFTALSFFCGFSQSLSSLVLFRLGQGFFGGGLQPCQQAIILDIFPPEQRGAAFSLTAIATVVAPVLGPLLGGWLTDTYDWRWVFYVNVPFGILTTILVWHFLEDPPWETSRREYIDIIGISLISIGLGCLEVMTDRGETLNWFGSNFICLMGFLGVTCTVAAVIWLCKAKNPLLSLETLKDKNFAVGTVLMGVLGVILYSGAVIVPQFAQQVQGYTATVAGEILAPGGIFIMILIPVVGKMMEKGVPLHYIAAFGFFVMALSMFHAANLYADVDYKYLVLLRISQTAPLAFLFVPISTFAFTTLPQRLNADGSALFSMVRNYFGSQAISLTNAALVETRQVHQNDVAAHVNMGKPAVLDYMFHAQKFAEAHGLSAMKAQSWAVANLYKQFMTQVSMLAYNQVFNMIGIMTISVIPLCFLVTSSKKSEKEG